MPDRRTCFQVFLLILMCLIVFPVFGQDIEPTSTPRPSTNTIISELSDAVESNGILAAVMVGVIVILVLIVAFFIFSVRSGLKPLLDTISSTGHDRTEAQRALVAMQQQMFEWQREQSAEREKINQVRQTQADSLSQTVEAQKGLARIMEQIETKGEAQSRSSQQVNVINEHTTTVINSLKGTLEQAVAGIAEVKTDLQSKLSKTDLTDGIQPIIDRLDIVSKEIVELRNSLSSTSLKVDPPSATTTDV